MEKAVDTPPASRQIDRMRRSRILAADGGFYHCMSRVVDRRFIFGDDEKRFFLHWMRRLERFCGLEVVTYCLMSNHFHILVRVPDRADIAPLDVAGLLDALPLLYGRDQVSAIAKDIDAIIKD